MFLATLGWLVLQHKQLLWIVSYNIGMTCVTTQTVCFEMFLATLGWLVLQHKQLVWNVSCKIGMTCVTTQTVALNCFLQHWYDLCYNTNSWVWIVSCNICMTCVTTQTVALNCFLQHWYDLCYNTNSCFELFLATLVWLVLQHKQLGLNCFLQHWYDLCYNTNSWVWIVSCNIGMTCVTTQTVALNCFLQHCDDLCYNTNSCFEMFLATLIWLVLQHKQLVWIISCNIGMICVTTQTVALNCFLQHWDDLCYNTNSCFEMFLTTLVWLVLHHKQLVGIVSYNIGMTCVTTHTVALKCFLQHWYALCYNTNSCLEMFLATLVWLVLQHKQLFWNVSFNIGMACVTTQTAGLNCFLQHWYDLCYNTNSWSELFLSKFGMTCVTTQTVGLNCFLQHWYDLCYNINSCFELFLATLGWLVLQHNQLLWNDSCNIDMTCVTTQTVGLNYFLQHWDDLCYNTNSCFELFLATLGWLVLQHKQLFWNVSCNIGMTCVTT